MKTTTQIQTELTEANAELETVNKRIAGLKMELREAKRREANPERLVDQFNKERSANSQNPFETKQS